MRMKLRTIKIDDFLWGELEKTSQRVKCNKSSLIRMAIIEKLQSINKEYGFYYENEANRQDTMDKEHENTLGREE